MGWPMIIAAAIAATESYRKQKQDQKNRDQDREDALNAFNKRIMDADAAGLHPLAALGVPLATGGGASFGGGGDYSQVADIISKLDLNSMKSEREEEHRWNMWLNAEDLSGKALDNRIKEEEWKQMRINNDILRRDAQFPKGSWNNPDVAAKVYEYTKPDGSKVKILAPNPELAEGMEGTWPGRIGLGMNLDYKTWEQFLGQDQKKFLKQYLGE